MGGILVGFLEEAEIEIEQLGGGFGELGELGELGEMGELLCK